MMRGLGTTLAAWALVTALMAQDTRQAQVTLQAAIMAETIEQDLPKAIRLYERAVKEAGADRAVGARALAGLANAQDRAGRSADARATYERILRDYANSGEPATTARTRLGRIGASPQRRADPFPVRAVTGGTEDRNVSPDGKFLVHRRGAPRDAQVILQDMSNGQQRVLLPDRGDYAGRTWSRDGTRLAYSFRRAGQELWEASVVNVITGEKQALMSGAACCSFAWSPDSRDLAIGEGAWNPRPEIRIVTLATGRVRSLVNGAMRLSGVDHVTPWTADNHIVFTRPAGGGGTDWFVVPAGGGEPRMICRTQGRDGDDLCGPVTPDGKTQVLFKRGTRRIVVRDITPTASAEPSLGETDRRLTNGTGEEHFLMLSPDGRLVAFEANHDGEWAVYVAPIDRAPVAAALKIGSLSRQASMPAEGGESWEGNGTLTLGFYSSEAHIYRVDVNASGRSTGPLQPLTQESVHNTRANVSRDGRLIAYWSYVTHNQRGGVALMDSSGANERVLARREPMDLNSAVFWRSPTELIVPPAERTPAGAGRQLSVLNVSTGASTPLPGGDLPPGACSAPAPSEQNLFWYVVATNELYYRYCRNPSPNTTGVVIRARSLADGRERDVLTFDHLGQFSVSPDGRQIAYTHWANGQRLGNVERQLWLAATTGTDAKLLFTGATLWDPTPFSWSPDSRYLLHQHSTGRGAPRSVRVIDVASGESWPLVADQRGLYALAEASWSPDGSFVVVTGRSDRYDWREWQGVTYDAVAKLMTRAVAPGGR